jgi:hypothetical protein
MRHRFLDEAPRLGFVRSRILLMPLRAANKILLGDGRRRGNNFAAGQGHSCNLWNALGPIYHDRGGAD